MVVARTKHDDNNRYLFYWSQEVIDSAAKRGLAVVELNNERANRKNLTDVICGKDPKFILLNGHGKPEFIMGHNDEKMIVLGDNHELLKSRIVYARACFSAGGIGKTCEKMGEGSCFIGYSHKYTFVADEHHISNPLGDPFAEPFRESSNIIPLTILKGNTVKEAMKRSEKAMRDNILKYETENVPGYSDIAFFLKWNMAIQVCLGDEEASLK